MARKSNLLSSRNLLIGAALVGGYLVFTRGLNVLSDLPGQIASIPGEATSSFLGALPSVDLGNIPTPSRLTSLYLPRPGIGMTPSGQPTVTYRPAITGPLSSTNPADWQSIWVA